MSSGASRRTTIVTALIGFVLGVGVTLRGELPARSEAVSLFGGEDRKPEAAPAPTGQGAVMLPDFAEIAEQLSPAVVNISSTQEVKSRGPFGPGGAAAGRRRRRRRRRRRWRRRRNGRGRSLPGVLWPVRTLLRTAPAAPRAKSLGSGFLIDPKGYIITNNHVVENADEIRGRSSTTGRSSRPRSSARDPKTDLALIKIEGAARTAGAAARRLRHAPGRRVGHGDRQSVRPRAHRDGRAS